jgi:hypothetical protein
MVVLGSRFFGRGSSGMFFEMLFDRIGLLACVHSGREFIRDDDSQTCAVFEGAELL